MNTTLRIALSCGLVMVWYCLTASAEPSGTILFVSNRDGNAQIYHMNSDGSAQQALTQGPEENTEPAWSPNGTRIAFTSYRDGNAEIYVMNADGSSQKRLTADRFADNSPLWAPDGRVIFRSNRDRWTNFYAVNSDGSGLKQLTNSPVDKSAPVLSPDGRWIAFVVHGQLGSSEIYVMPAGGGEPHNLTAALTKNRKFFPSWAPDSLRLAYLESKDRGLNINVIDPDGSHPVKITDNPYTNAFPVWSPDGNHIAFVSSREGTRMEMARGDIYVMKADGSAVTNLTRSPDEDNYPAWSADGRSIYFVSLRNGMGQIYAVPSQGGELRRLTSNKGFDVMIRPLVLSTAKKFQPKSGNESRP